MEIELKARPMRVKQPTDEGEGTFDAIVSAFDVVDSYGDVLRKGAFARSLKEWEDDGGQIPFLWSHAIDDPMSYVGGIETAEETDEGLLVHGRFDLDTEQSRQAFKLLRAGRIKEFSFGFIVRESGVADFEGERVNEVTDVDLLEVSMTMLGANPATRLVAIKAARAAKAADTTPTNPPGDGDPAAPGDDAEGVTLEAIGKVVKAQTLEALTEFFDDGDSPAAPEDDDPDKAAPGGKSAPDFDGVASDLAAILSK